MLKEGSRGVSSQPDPRLNNSYQNVYTSGNNGIYSMETPNTGSYNARAYTGDSPGSSSESKSPNSSAIPTCVVTPTSTEKGYLSYDDESMGAYIPSRKQREFIPENKKDDGYWEKRRKNNEAARRSREKRRYHDMALENRIMDLTRDNCKLRNELTAIKKRFGIPLSETIISDDDDPAPLPQRSQPPPSNVSPPRTPAQHAIPPATLSTALQQKGPSVQQNAVRARSYSGSIALQYQGSYSLTSTQKPPYQTSVSPIDSYYPNTSGQRESGSRYYPPAQPQDYSTSKSIRERSDSIPMSGRSDLTERSAYSSNFPPSMVPQYNSSLSGTNPTSYWQQSADLTSSDSNDEGDWGDQVQEEPLSLVKKSVEENNSSNSDLSNNSSRASNSPTSSSALPLKLRHKIPQDGMPTAFPTTPSIPRYANGLAQLSEIALASSNLPLMSSDDYNGQDIDSIRYRSRSFSNPRSPYDKRYVERRRKNNEAARKCRENRKRMTKIREVKSGYLESENGKLKDELTDLQVEMKQLREMLEKKQQNRGLQEGETGNEVEGNDDRDKDDMNPGKLIIETKTEPIDEFDRNVP